MPPRILGGFRGQGSRLGSSGVKWADTYASSMASAKAPALSEVWGGANDRSGSRRSNSVVQL